MIIEPTEEMLRAGQEALFEVCPEYTIEERENVAREVWAAMEAAAGVFGGTPKTDPDYEESEAALRASFVARLSKWPAPINDPDLNDQAADCLSGRRHLTKHEDTTQAAGGSPVERGVRPARDNRGEQNASIRDTPEDA